MFNQYNFILVVILLGVAAALLTDSSKLPLPLRGLRKALGTERGGNVTGNAAHRVAAWRRWLAFALVILAFVIVFAG